MKNIVDQTIYTHVLDPKRAHIFVDMNEVENFVATDPTTEYYIED
jgi:hypothetical protein